MDAVVLAIGQIEECLEFIDGRHGHHPDDVTNAYKAAVTARDLLVRHLAVLRSQMHAPIYISGESFSGSFELVGKREDEQ